ncbi:MAG: hypothetical protein WBQ44_15565 [Rhodococcus sp. (in: high G+C Gram-positive bacteria)]
MKSGTTLAEQASAATTLAVISLKAIDAFRRHGVDVRRIDASTLGSDSGAKFPLENLMDRCLENNRSVWDRIVDMHARTMAEAVRESDPSELSDDEFYSRLRERIVPPNALTRYDAYDYSRPLVESAPDGPQRVLGLSYPGRALLLPDGGLIGRDIDTAWAAGRANTASLDFDEYETVIKGGVGIEVRRGNSIFLASKVADMPTLVSDHLGECPFGVLFAVPNSHEIDYYRPCDAADAERGAVLLGELANLLFAQQSPVSREVFYWRDGQYTRWSDYAVMTASSAE